MLKDDRMMSMMTFLVVMFALGTVLSRTDLFGRYLGGEASVLELVRDDAVVVANQLSSIDVLGNDRGVTAEDGARLEIAEQPKCGRVYVRGGVIQYLAAQRCVGSQSFRYTLAGRAGGQTGEVVAVVRLGQPATEATSAGNPAGAGEGGAADRTPTAGIGAGTGQVASGAATGQPDAAATTAPLPGREAGPAAATRVTAGDGTGGGERVPGGPERAVDTDPGRETDPGADGAFDHLTAGGPPAEPSPSLALAPGDAEGTAAPAQRRRPTQPCDTRPTLTLDPEPGGITEIAVDAPCQAGTVAELAYDGLSFGIALDGKGAGSVRAVGLQGAADAVIRFADRSETRFLVTFDDLDRIERVVLQWDAPVSLGLHAFEFGAAPADLGHVAPGRARSFDEVRRRGGGFLLDFAPVEGIGQNLQVYSYWRGRRGGRGVVRLAVEFADRTGPDRPGTCGAGDHAAPEFRVLRSIGGRIERPSRGQLAPLDCAAVAGLPDRLIAGAVDDLVVMQR